MRLRKNETFVCNNFNGLELFVKYFFEGIFESSVTDGILDLSGSFLSSNSVYFS